MDCSSWFTWSHDCEVVAVKRMAAVDLRCDTVPWATSVRTSQGRQIELSHGLSAGNFVQFVCEATDTYKSGYFAFALYLTHVTLKGRVIDESPEEIADSSGAQVTHLSGILLPFLLQTSMPSYSAPGVDSLASSFISLPIHPNHWS